VNYETILLKKENNIATITLNRPQAMNAITMQMFDELNAALQDVSDDKEMNVMVITGAGKAFCASADLKVVGGEAGKRLFHFMSIEETRQLARKGPQGIVRKIIDMGKPTIAMVNGVALGDGFDWCLACDIRIGSPNARFMNAYVKMAIFPNTGATWFYPRIMPLGKALELLYTGDWLEAEEAYELGVLNKLVPAESLEEETMALARRIAAGPPASLRLMKMQTYKGLEIGLDPVPPPPSDL
jgi:enoyl-CoA hydratase/carnithine racemase